MSCVYWQTCPLCGSTIRANLLFCRCRFLNQAEKEKWLREEESLKGLKEMFLKLYEQNRRSPSLTTRVLLASTLDTIEYFEEHPEDDEEEYD